MTIEEKILMIGVCKAAARQIVTSLEASIGQGPALPAVVKAVALYDCLADMEQGLADYADNLHDALTERDEALGALKPFARSNGEYHCKSVEYSRAAAVWLKHAKENKDAE